MDDSISGAQKEDYFLIFICVKIYLTKDGLIS